jgi:hypothetical protein
VEDDRFGIGVVEEIPELVVEIPVVDVDRHAAHLEDAELGLHELVRVVHEQRDLGTGSDPRVGQRRGDPGRHDRRSCATFAWSTRG